MVQQTGRTWDGHDSRDGERETLRRFVPAPLLVQLAASHAGIGPFARQGRETPAAAALGYRRTALRLIRSIPRTAHFA